MTVLVEHGGSGSSATPIAKKFFKKIINRNKKIKKIKINDTILS